MQSISWLACVTLAISMSVALSACAPQQPSGSDMASRQDQALKHPFDYSTGQDFPDISGGGLGEFDPKAAGRDVNSVFNP